MPRNIELKARFGDLNAAEAVCRRLGARRAWKRRQTDVYFAVSEGRLKLRIQEPGDAMLVAYERPDAPGLRESRYRLTPVDDAQATRNALAAEHGVLVEVRKIRTLYLLGHIRIHLDDVAGLGTFIEFEAVMDPSHNDADTGRQLEALLTEFGIAEADTLAASYSDLLLARGAQRDAT